MSYGLSSYELTILVVAVFLIVIGIGLGLYTRSRLQRRKAQLLGELQKRPDLVQDRAFNRIAMARREVDLLAQQGTDVDRARAQIAEAQAAFDNRHYEEAYRSAQIAHESLVGARRGRTPLPSSAAPPARTPGNSTTPPPAGAQGSPPPRARWSSAPASSAPPVPKNRAESQFQLRLLDQELSVARSDHPETPSTVDAGDLASRARAAFDGSDFTEAFRLALKGRRTLGGSIESLPPPSADPSAPARNVASHDPNRNGGVPTDVAHTAEKVAGAERCPECGYPAVADDAFCRGCGRPRAPPTCPKCGTARTVSDTFCGRCGARFT